MSVKVAIVGVGNCASALVQGVSYYSKMMEERPDVGEFHPGLVHNYIGGYGPRDIEFVAAFDVDADKVGKPLGEAIWAGQNNTLHFGHVKHEGVEVQPCPTMDGIGERYAEKIDVVSGTDVQMPIDDYLRSVGAEVIVNYLPVGSETATRWWAGVALRARCAFVNCIPVFIASEANGAWRRQFEEAGLPLLGDDIKSQFGATIVHRRLTELFAMRGIKVERTYQLNFGGNMDFYSMLNSERLKSKKQSKGCAVTSTLPYKLDEDNIHISPSDYVPWLEDQKVAMIRIEGTAFGGAPLVIDVRMQVWDSPNSAGVVIDAVRCAKVALDRGVGGALTDACALLYKSPPVQMPDDEAEAALEAFIGD